MPHSLTTCVKFLVSIAHRKTKWLHAYNDGYYSDL